MSVGSHRRLEQEDLLDLPPELQPAECRRIMWANWKQVWPYTNVMHFLRMQALAAPPKLGHTHIAI